MSPEMSADLPSLGRFDACLFKSIKWLGTGWITTKDSQCSSHPDQRSARKLDVGAGCEMDCDHLVAESVRRVQHVSAIGKQHEIPNPLSVGRSVIAFDHIAESLNRSSKEQRGAGTQGMRMFAQ